ncbi:thiamine/thiamine pyrophosphate ABC transporter permease ThiP [Palleronia sediminis]|uniref:Thiamine/thiamine pyrophosphate ABC transporter permease ThiP n=1 Tax=Palleronia sediminis TaxID=2547833 RepID=A0A4V3B9A7_9RHOB|nr:thiamine/thiamine pyrophosphate ABC transporter permease ThiP [Palleronia sediminis]TDL78459.1 thiamine/thiamine pyrophosphate ABC transporter permease ThiP [Palleronia sediminis]
MARGARPLTVAGLGSAALVAALVLGTVIAVFARAEGAGALGPADWAAIRFTLWQAALSSALSVALAIPVARALARRRFLGRGLLITLLGAPFILPVIVAVLGLLMVFGRAGWVNDALGAVGLPSVAIYGVQGVILGHVFFNLPLAVRLILQGWLSVPAERFRLAASLGMGAGAIFRTIEAPMLRAVLPGVALVIFLVCTSSFAVALTLGGGPRATTVELAIYQAFRFDFDLGRAALLAVVQLAVTLAAGALALSVAVPSALGAGLDRVVRRWDRAPGWPDALAIALAAAFLLVPLAALVTRGAPSLLSLPPVVWAAAGRSLAVAVASAALCLVLTLPLAVAIHRTGRRAGRGLEVAGMLGIAASPLVIGTGLFIVTFPFVAPGAIALAVTGLVNAVMAMPFALRALGPAVAEVERDWSRLAQSLGMGGWARLRLVLLPRLRRPLGFAGGLAAALSMGDLGVVTLFADGQSATLPLQLFRLMGAYRMDDAAGAALLLLGLSLALFWLFDRGGRVNA